MSEAPKSQPLGLFRGSWQERLRRVLEMLREMSLQTDPQLLVERYASRVRQLTNYDAIVAVSRRDLPPPKYKITRTHLWRDRHVNPWRDTAQLPVLQGGILGEWLYGERATVVEDFHVDPEDPAYEHLSGFRSCMVLPSFDEGVARNLAVILSRQPGFFSAETLPEQLWITNLFGRVTHNLRLRQQLKEAYDAIDRELKVVGDIQRSLLPEKIPAIQNLQLASHYLTSTRAGGDYYDFFPLPNDRWGIFIADVSGHGTPAAVLMAVTHSIAHAVPGDPDPPSRLLAHVNQQLARRYTNGTGTFVTAFYGIFDPKTRSLTYASAGHPQPRAKSCGGGCASLKFQSNTGLPLGIVEDEVYVDETVTFSPGDVLIFYTDGITEARSPAGELFGVERLDETIACCASDTEMIIRNILLRVEEFTDSAAPTDDQTLIVARVQ